jgi:hypothetical protein
MRRLGHHGMAVVVVSLVATVGVFGMSREPRERTRDRESPVVKFVKRVVRALGDGITVPTPAPKP